MEPCVLPIHFGNFVGKHEINADSLVVFLDAYRDISEVWGVSVEIQVGVPEEGGWKSNLAILCVAVNFIGINPISILLTGESADEWAKKSRGYIIQKINEFIATEADKIPDGLPKECLRHKNKIYEQFQKDKCIDTFRLGNFPPIPSNNFHLYIKQITDDDVEYIGETDIVVHSPDWKGRRSWRGKIEVVEDKESAFDFDKELTGKFWEKVKLDALLLHTTDTMRVQLVKRPNNKVKYMVVRVLSYNSEIVDSPISRDDIRKIAVLDATVAAKKTADQLDLFA